MSDEARSRLRVAFSGAELKMALRREAEDAEGALEVARKREVAQALVASLSPRQSEVLALLVIGASNEEMSARLGIGPRAVKSHRKQLMKKLDAGSSADAVRIGIYAHIDPG